jgi:hypothetical protein
VAHIAPFLLIREAAVHVEDGVRVDEVLPPVLACLLVQRVAVVPAVREVDGEEPLSLRAAAPVPALYGAAPTRNYAFDVDFLTPALLPPNTPVFRDMNAVGFSQELRPGR